MPSKPAILARTKCSRHIRRLLKEEGPGGVRVGLREDGVCTAPLTHVCRDAAFIVRWAWCGWVGLEVVPGSRLWRPPLDGRPWVEPW